MPIKIARHLPLVLLIGIAIGIGNYAIGLVSLLGRSVLQSIITSFIIGLPLTAYAEYITDHDQEVLSSAKSITKLFLIFAGIGIIGSELLLFIIQTAIEGESYFPFSGGGTYLFNAIISEILGFTFVDGIKNKKQKSQHVIKSLPKRITNLPVKKGQTISFIALDEILYFEANDKFSFFYDKAGSKKISDYSLAYLEPRLPENFLRIHRKYLVNTQHIKDIQYYAKGRYSIRFVGDGVGSIISSQGYSEQIKSLIKI